MAGVYCIVVLCLHCAVAEVELTRQTDSRVKSLYIDPRGVHVLACIKTSNNYEVQYIHSSGAKPRALSKLKGLAVTAVGWQKQPSSGEDERPGSAGSRGRPAAGEEEEELLVSTG